MEHARLDNRFSGPPADPLVYGDVVVSHPEGTAWVNAAADADGATAAGAARGKHSRYPAFALPGGRLVAFSVEAFGRWGSEALEFLRGAAEATCERSPQLAFLGSWGVVALLGTWHGRLSVALQKGNVACLLQAGRVRDAGDLAGDPLGRRTWTTCCGTRRRRLPPGVWSGKHVAVVVAVDR